MKKILIFIIFLALISLKFVPGQTGNETPVQKSFEREQLLKELEDDDTTPIKYQINAILFPEKREVRCEEILKFTNSSDVEINKIFINLFYNAFKNNKTSFFQESGIFKLTEEKISDLKFGYIEIIDINIINRGKKFKKDIKFISPDDNNPEDKTAAEIRLKKPVLPGNSLWLNIRFRLKLPEIFFKTGQADNYIFISHWYPRTGLLNKDGSWDIHQFHRKDRFIENFANYNVKITVPSKFKLGTTGTIVNKKETGKGQTVYEINAQNVHDFAWVAFPYFKEIHKKLRLKGNNFDTDIILLLSPGHRSAESRYMSAIIYAINYMSDKIAPYPYETLTVVDPPLKGFNSAGYKYPGLISSAYLKLFPYSLKITELSIFQGIASQYWYGIISSRDFNSIRMEDGAASFFEMEIMDSYFMNRASFFDSFFIDIYDWELKRLIYLELNHLSKPKGITMGFLMNKCYFSNLNFSVSLLLRSLKNYIGKEKMYAFFEYYLNKYKFHLSGTDDFIETFNNYFNEDYSWAFNQFVKNYSSLDTAVYSVASDKIAAKEGVFRNEAVFVRNKGYFPVELKIHLKNGKELKMFWKEKEKWKKVVFEDNSPLDFAEIDPGFKIPLDINLVNNSMSTKKNLSVFDNLIMKFGFLFQNVLSILPL